MKNWTVKKWIGAGFGALVIVNTLVGILILSGVVQMRSYATSIANDALPGIYLLGKVDAKAREIFSLMPQHIFADTVAETKQFDDRIEQLKREMDQQLMDYLPYCAEYEKPMLAKVQAKKEAFYASWQEVRALSLILKNTEALIAFKKSLVPVFHDYEAAIVEDLDWNSKDAGATCQASRQTGNFTLVGVAVGLIFTFLLGLAGSAFVARQVNGILHQLVGHIGNSVAQVASSSDLVSAASQKLAQDASQQAVLIEEISALSEETGSMAKRNADSAHQAKLTSMETLSVAELGTQRMQEMQVTMQLMQQSSAEMLQAIQDIKASSDNVSKIIKTIDEVAFQTNILALNAAVEAARAGASGAGFAVVADEVRNLAQRSARAAQETAQMIETSVAQSQRGVLVNGKVTQAITEIVLKASAVQQSLNQVAEKARIVDGHIHEITVASQEQSGGLEKLNQSIFAAEQITQSNAAGSEEVAGAAEELHAQAKELRTAVVLIE